MPYDAPGRADVLDPALVDAWNATIQSNHQEVLRELSNLGVSESRFFTLDPDELTEAKTVDVVHWPGDPLEPTFCVNRETVRTLCDWGVRGRHVLQNEYCEYAVVGKADASGRIRPKRIQLTTELPEYWTCLATHDPDRLRAVATAILGEEPPWHELYGVSEPHGLSKDERRLEFAETLAGHGNHKDLKDAGVPRDPRGRLNTENALFMTYPINGLDDLIFIVLFGARRFAVRQGDGTFRRAEANDIFAGDLQELVCRHADPTAALGAYDLVLDSRRLAFADPLGMYIRTFNPDLLLFDGKPLPQAWVRWSRGDEGMRQRLELGPGDDDDAFLDQIVVNVGEPEPLVGGYQLIKLLEVGPLIATAPTREANEDEFTLLEAGASVNCRETSICERVNDLKEEHDSALSHGSNSPSAPGV